MSPSSASWSRLPYSPACSSASHPRFRSSRLNPNDALKEACSERRPVSPQASRRSARGDGDRAGLRAAGRRRPDDAESCQPARRGCRIRQRERADGTLALPRSTSPESTAVFFRELLVRLRARPAVAEAGFTTHIPMSGDDSRSGLGVEGRERDPREGPVRAHWRIVDAWLFRRHADSAGPRTFPTEDDTARRAPVAVINRTAARTLLAWAESDWETAADSDTGVSRDHRRRR